MTRPAHSANRHQSIALVAIVATALVVLASCALVGILLLFSPSGQSDNIANQTPAPPSLAPSTPVAASASATPSPSVDPSVVATASSPAPKPLATGNGSGCDVGKTFQVKLREDTVDRTVGANFHGTACLKRGQTVWAFNFDNTRGLYILASGKMLTPAPVITKKGIWSWTDFEVDTNTTVNFVLANSTCASWLRGQDPNDDFGGRIVLNNIQRNGCRVIATQDITTVV